MEVRVIKLKNIKTAGKDKASGEIIKNGGQSLVDWI